MADDLTNKYEQIAYEVRKQILNGTYKPNQQLPLERDMEQTFDASRTTVKKAIDILVQEGYVVKRRGAGTFVKDFNMATLQQSNSQYRGFSEKYQDHEIKTDVLVFNIERPDDEIAAKLSIKTTDFVYHIERVRSIDGSPLTYQRTYIPIDLLIGLRFDSVIDSLYLFVEETARLKIQSAHENVSAVMPNDAEQTALKIPANLPLLQIEIQVFLDSGQLFEYTVSKYRSDKMSFHAVELR